MRQLNFYKAHLVLLFASIVSGQRPELLWRSNVNCNGRSAVCVGPLSYQNCTEVSGVQVAQGEVFTCKLGYRCKNDGADICVPIRLSLGDVTTEGPNKSDSIIVGKTLDLLPSNEVTANASTVGLTTVTYETTVPIDTPAVTENSTANSPLLETRYPTDIPTVFDYTDVSNGDKVAAPTVLPEQPSAQPNAALPVIPIVSHFVNEITTVQSESPETTTENSNQGNPWLSSLLPLQKQKANQVNPWLSDLKPVPSVKEVPLAQSNPVPQDSAPNTTHRTANGVSVLAVAYVQDIANPSAAYAQPEIQTTEVTLTLSGEPSALAAAEAPVVPINSQSPANEAAPTQNGAVPSAVEPWQPANDNSNVVSGSDIANPSVQSAQPAIPTNNIPAYQGNPWLLSLQPVPSVEEVAESQSNSLPLAAEASQPSLLAAAGVPVDPINSQVPVNEVALAQSDSAPLPADSSQPIYENGNVFSAPSVPAVANPSVLSGQSATPINNAPASWTQANGGISSASGQPSVVAAPAVPVDQINSQVPVNEVAAAQFGSAPLPADSSQPIYENGNVFSASPVPAFANPSVVSGQSATPINNAPASWTQPNGGISSASGQPSVVAAPGVPVDSINSQVPFNEVAPVQSGSAPLPADSSQAIYENGNIVRGSPVPAVADPSAVSSQSASPINNAPVSWIQANGGILAVSGQPSVVVAPGVPVDQINSQVPVNEVAPAQSGSAPLPADSSQPIYENGNVFIASPVPAVVNPSVVSGQSATPINNAPASWTQANGGISSASGQPSVVAAPGVPVDQINSQVPVNEVAAAQFDSAPLPANSSQPIYENGNIFSASPVPVVANPSVVSGQSATPINNAPASWTQANGGISSASGQPSVVAAPGVPVDSINSQVPVNEVAPVQSGSAPLPADSSQPIYENGNVFIASPVPAVANPSVVFGQSATPINNAPASWTQANGGISSASGQPSVVAAPGVPVDQINSQVPVNEVAAAQFDSAPLPANSSQPIYENGNIFSASPVPVVANPSVVSGQSATPINNAPASWTQANGGISSASGQPSVVAAPGVPVDSINSQVPVNEVAPLQSGSAPLPADSSQPIYENGNVFIASPVPAVANPSVVSGQSATPINNAPASWTQANGGISSASGQPSVVAAPAVPVDQINSQVPVNEVAAAQFDSAPLPANSSQPIYENGNIFSASPVPVVANPSVVSGQSATPINNAPASWTQANGGISSASGQPSVIAALGVPVDSINSQVPVNEVAPVQSGSAPLPADSSQSIYENGNVVVAALGVPVDSINSQVPVNEVAPVQSGSAPLPADSSQPIYENGNVFIASPVPAVVNPSVVSGQSATPINNAPASWTQGNEGILAASGQPSVVAAPGVPVVPVNSQVPFNEVAPAQSGSVPLPAESSQSINGNSNDISGSHFPASPSPSVVSDQAATAIKKPSIIWKDAVKGNPWLSGLEPVPSVALHGSPAEKPSDPVKPNPWLSWVPNWPWDSNKESKSSNKSENSASNSLNDNTSEEMQSNENKSSQSNESQSESDSSNESVSKEIKRAVEDILKSLKNGNCKPNTVYPNPTKCNKYYRCVQKSSKNKLEELHCDDREQFDAKKLLCKEHGECITKERFIQNYS